MNETASPHGWQLHHHEQLFFRASIGAPTIRLKFFHYPAYRQTVIVNKSPAGCVLKTKRDNTFYVFQQKVRTKGIISLERVVTIHPSLTSVSPYISWGRISEVPRPLQRKYKQSFTYWPISSASIQTISQEHWFDTDDLASWVRAASSYISSRIKFPEPQEKRLGADQVLRTGSGDCDEFTDLFITLARNRGIPCRRLTGYFIHFPNNKAEPHAWGEILSPTIGWIPIDLAMRNIGKHTINYVIHKIEEFIPLLLDYQITRQTSAVQYHWERPLPEVTLV
jgi:hypothetical protein